MNPLWPPLPQSISALSLAPSSDGKPSLSSGFCSPSQGVSTSTFRLWLKLSRKANSLRNSSYPSIDLLWGNDRGALLFGIDWGIEVGKTSRRNSEKYFLERRAEISIELSPEDSKLWVGRDCMKWHLHLWQLSGEGSRSRLYNNGIMMVDGLSEGLYLKVARLQYFCLAAGV